MTFNGKFYSLGLSRQVILLLIVTILPIIFIFAYITYKNQQNNYLNVIKSSAKTYLQTTILLIQKEILREDYSKITQDLLSLIGTSSTISYVYVQKVDNSLILYIHENRSQLLKTLPKDLSLFATSSATFGLIDAPNEAQKVYNASIPIMLSGYKWGWIHAGFYTDEYEKNLKLLLFWIALFVTLTIMGIFVLGSFIGGLLATPLLELTKLTKRVTMGDLETKGKIVGKNEVAYLTKNFNIMVRELKSSEEKLKASNVELENRVKKRTHELEELNATLDKRVQDEVSKRRQQQDLLVHQSRLAAMGEMIGNIAHQWRQPLNALGLTIQNIQTAYENNYLNEEYIQKTIDKSKRLTKQMSQTINDFRDFFKPNQKKELFCLKEAIDQCVEIVEASLKHNSICLDVNVDDKIMVDGYKNQFSQVVLNLISNSKDALQERDIKDGVVTITTSKDKFSTILHVKDNAGGISKDIIDKIYDPYFTTKEQGQGTGIGLYMSKMIIEKNMNGRLSVKNIPNGTMFDVELKSCEEEI